MNIILMLVISLISSFPSNAQNLPLKINNVATRGNAPSISSGPEINLKQGTAFDPKHECIYFLYNDLLWKFTLSTHRWHFLDTLSIDNDINYLAYDTLQNRLLMWDRGVGRVYERTQNGAVERLDHSFEQKNQFGHLGWFDQKSSSIYAFGGYGLFSLKNFITYYDQSTREWLLLKTAKSKFSPSPQTEASGVFDSQNQILWMIGSSSNSRNQKIETSSLNDKKALWQFNLESKKWSKKLNLPTGYIPDDNGLHYSDKLYYSYIPSQGWTVFPMYHTNNADEQSHHQLFFGVYDFHTNVFSRLPIDHSYLPQSFLPVNIFWIKDNQTFLILGWRFLSNQQMEEAVFYNIPLQHFTALNQYISQHQIGQPVPKMSSSLKMGFPYSDWSSVLFLFIGIILGITVTYVYQIKKQQRTTDYPKNPTNKFDSKKESSGSSDVLKSIRHSKKKRREITIVIDSSPEIWFHGQKMSADFPARETELLLLLAKRFKEGNPHILTDDVDQIIWKDYSNVDYVRKLRNKTIDRLEHLFQQINPLEANKHYICRRNYVHDQRKVEYFLNPQHINVQ